MMRLIFFSLILLSFSSAHTQPEGFYPDSSCLKIVQELKKNWRLDSMGNNGYRLANYKKFLICNPDYLYPDYLLNAIGMPNETWSTATESNYIYYYTTKAFPNGFTRINYICFKVTSPRNYVVEIDIGEIKRYRDGNVSL